MTLFRVLLLCVFFYELSCVDSAIVNSPTNHHANNIISKDEATKNTTIVKIPIDKHAEIVAMAPEDAESTGNEKIEQTKTPMKTTFPSSHHKKVLTTIIHPLPRTMHDIMPPESSHPTQLDHKKAHDDILKHEVPKLQKMLHHHFTVEDLRQRRKEFKEKWLARHNKLSHVTPHGLHDKNPQDVGSFSPKVKNEPHPETLRKNIQDMYEQITPRTRRILEHKEEETESQEHLHPLRAKHRFSARTRTTLPTLPSTQPEKHPEPTTESHFNPNYVNFPIMPDPQIAPMYYYPTRDYTSSSTTKTVTGGDTDRTTGRRQGDIRPTQFTTTKSSRLGSVAKKTTTSPPEPVIDDVVSVKIDTSKLPDEEYTTDIQPVDRDLTFEKKYPYKPIFTPRGKSAEEVGSMDSHPSLEEEQVGSIDVHPGLENEQVTVKIDTPPFYRNLTHEEKILIQRPLWGLGRSAEQVGSIDIHPGLENEQVTVKIDTPPFYRNLTHEEKILIQRPLFGLGKSAEQNGSMDSEEEQVGSIDIHPGLENEQVTVKIDTPPFYRNLTHEEKILIQRPLFGLGKSAEQVGSIDIHPVLEKEEVTVKIDTPPYYKKLTHEEKILKQRPLFGSRKSAEPVGSMDSHSSLEEEQVGSIDIHPGLENEQVTVKIDTPPFYRNLTHEEKILIQRPLFGLGKSAEQVGSIDIHPGLENEQVTVKIDTPPFYRNLTHEEKILIQRPLFGLGKSTEEVGSIDIHSGLENEQVTVKIDTPPFYRNLTHDEKILIQRPLFGLGKSAEEVDSIVENRQIENEKFTVNVDPTPPFFNSLTDKEKSVIQKPMCGRGKSAEGADCSHKGPTKHGKRSYAHTTNLPEGNSMKIDEVNQDWREHLRRAVKERLRKLSDSEEKPSV